MDGNRRWAKERNLAAVDGHRAGYELVKKLGPWCLSRGVRYLTIYAFSCENWKRAKEEVGYLMDLLMGAVTRDLSLLTHDRIRLKIIGRRADLSSALREAIGKAEKETEHFSAGTLQLAISYGGRDEIVRAARQAALGGEITEDSLAANLDTAGAPDPDLIIRTSGEERLSGFLTWQSAYSELIFLDKYWPDFSEDDLDACLQEYASRERRYGK